MKTLLFFTFLLIKSFSGFAQSNDKYETSVTFPGTYQVGDYVEFVQTSPIDAGASGYYEVSISYTRSGIAAAATYIASVSHANYNKWREAGMVNSNGYVVAEQRSFTIDCNGSSSRFRIRAIATYGYYNTEGITVNIKVRSINFNTGWTALNNAGNDISVTQLHPMTNEWSLYTGNLGLETSAHIAFHAKSNGNVGIGTRNPMEKLSVNGKIRAKEIKVETAENTWPDYVFIKEYKLPTLADVEKHIKEKGHLPEVPSASEVSEHEHGLELGNNQALLLKKIEELTLYMIDMKKTVDVLIKENKEQARQIEQLKK
ncbi:hypothetical protein [Niabella hibiscisoli]|uniref:hypothetical protein n=1 Tax=Niabella hibiscisoli TaxID=1825928 RepID=UPI001F0FC8C7|nr:hypothetical protein [Niabella hibiscisoli]MCH5718189.1 hypothetical protein [Niabella hibiscisoli]